MTSLEEWIASRRIEEVDCMVPDMSGIALAFFTGIDLEWIDPSLKLGATNSH